MTAEARYFAGLDLGQAQDFTALAALERVFEPPTNAPSKAPPRYDVRHLQRWRLGTGYPQIVNDLKVMFARPPLAGATLVLDRTGVGRPVIDQVRAAKLGAGRITGVTITAGNTASRAEGGDWNVPKKDLVGVLQVLLQSRRLRIAKDLPDAEVLARELENFRVKVTAAANETYESWREGDHDDLLLAVAVAAWIAERPTIRAGGLC